MSLVRAIRQAVTGAGWILSVLVPPLCITCGSRLRPDRKWLCERCAISLACEISPMRLKIDMDGGRHIEARYCFRYTPVISTIIAEMKYGDKPGLAEILAPFLGIALGGRAGPETAVVPVPVHASKLRERGYNQSRLLAEGLARSQGLRLADLLVKTRATVSQTGLARGRRLGNVVGSIGLRDKKPFGFARVLLVDDVVTTGSTLRECACVLEAAGIVEIGACALAASL